MGEEEPRVNCSPCRGLFNPRPGHRLHRILRRHLLWLDFPGARPPVAGNTGCPGATSACGTRSWPCPSGTAGTGTHDHLGIPARPGARGAALGRFSRPVPRDLRGRHSRPRPARQRAPVDRNQPDPGGEDMAEACRRQLREQGRGPPYHLLGLSMGGMVAVAWARNHPDECRGAVLINTSLRPHGRLPRAPATGRHGRAAADVGGRPRRTGAGHPGTHQRPRGPNCAMSCLPGTSGRANARWRAATPCASCWPPRPSPAPEKPAVPLLILAGARDRMVRPACSRRLARALERRLSPASCRRARPAAGRWRLGGEGGEELAWLAGPPNGQSDNPDNPG